MAWESKDWDRPWVKDGIERCLLSNVFLPTFLPSFFFVIFRETLPFPSFFNTFFIHSNVGYPRFYDFMDGDFNINSTANVLHGFRYLMMWQMFQIYVSHTFMLTVFVIRAAVLARWLNMIMSLAWPC